MTQGSIINHFIWFESYFRVIIDKIYFKTLTSRLRNHA